MEPVVHDMIARIEYSSGMVGLVFSRAPLKEHHLLIPPRLPLSAEIMFSSSEIFHSISVSGVITQYTPPFVTVMPTNTYIHTPQAAAQLGMESPHEVKCLDIHESIISTIYAEKSQPTIELDLTPSAFVELEELVRYAYGQEIANMDCLRRTTNTVYHLQLDKGTHVICKEFREDRMQYCSTEHHFANILAKEGLGSPVIRRGNRLLRIREPRIALSQVPPDDRLASLYDAAIDLLVAFDRIARRDSPSGAQVTPLDESYYEHACGTPYNPRMTSRSAFMPLDAYPFHFIVGESMNVIDLERVGFGPAEFALATLLVNINHDLSPAFIQGRLEYFCSRTNVDRKHLAESFTAHATLARKRIEKTLVRIEKCGEEETCTRARLSLEKKDDGPLMLH